VLTGHTSLIFDLAFSPQDSNTLASVSEDDTIRLWDTDTRMLKTTIAEHTADVVRVDFNPVDGTFASGGWDATVRFWDAETGAHLDTITGHTDYVLSVSFRPDGRALVGRSWDSTIRLWNTETGKLDHILFGHTDDVGVVVFSPDGRTLASGSEDHTVRLWDVDTGAHLKTLVGHRAYLISLAFSEDGTTLASGSEDDDIRLWDVATGARLKTLVGHTTGVEGLAFSPNGRKLASASRDSTVRIWDVGSGEELHMLEGHWGNVLTVDFSPDGSTIASGGWDAIIRLWDATTGELVKSVDSFQSGIRSITFSPDGKMIATGGWDSIVRLWDTNTLARVKTLHGHKSIINSIAFNGDGDIIATGGFDGALLLWDTPPVPAIFVTTLDQGLNMISLPLMPEDPISASRFAEMVNATAVIRLDTATQDYVAFTDDERGPGFPIEGGLAYIVNTPEGGSVAFSGKAWEDEPATAPGVDRLAEAWAFVVASDLQNALPRTDYTVVAKNLRTGAIATERVTAAEARAAVVWADLNRNSVVQSGDRIDIKVIDDDGNIVSGPHHHTVDVSDIRQAYKRIQLIVGDVRPEQTQLAQNFPNPFNPETWMPFQLSQSSAAAIQIYDVSGRLVRTLDLGFKPAGFYMTRTTAAYWDGRNSVGEKVVSGIYFYTLKTDEFAATRKMLISK
ncbi:MAG: T9SS type A sorting domain-containing protein, partial [Candidatus Poribacteria bacterium]|nr:T9SS type A sorting domain-containing protein [Candidatus Poribacteria bacterium]